MDQSREQRCLRRALWLVAGVAVATNGFCLAATHLWIYPDSIDYIQLAGGIADRFDLNNELFLLRTPGYPLFLAVVFRLAGSWSPGVILVLQHAMAVATALLVVIIAWHLTRRAAVSCLAGVMCACSLQVLSYANMVLAEVPFTLAVTAYVYFLLRYYRLGMWRQLFWASVMVGIAYLLRPIALSLLGAGVLAVLLRAWNDRHPLAEGTGSGWRYLPRRSGRAASTDCAFRDSRLLHLVRRTTVGVVVAIAPALAVASPWMLKNAFTHRSLQATRCLDYVLYLRAVTFDGLDSARSAAMGDVHEVVAEAIDAGYLPSDADFRDRRTVMQAYAKVRGESLIGSSELLGQAAREVMREHPWSIAVNTVKYAGWMLLGADPVYRFLPGGAPGVNGERDIDAAYYDIGTYSRGAGSWEWLLWDYRHYLPLKTEPRTMTRPWVAMVGWFHHHIDRAAPLTGLRDSPYEEFILLCLAGGLFSLFVRRRGEWLLVASVIILTIGVSAFLGGPLTRYAAPIKPLLLLYATLPLVSSVRFIVTAISGLRTRPDRIAGGAVLRDE